MRYKISEIIDFNPKRELKRGTTASFIEMAALPTNSREVEYIGKREFKGGGSKFKNGDTLFARITPCLQNGKTAKVYGLENDGIAHGSTEFIVMAAKEPDYDEDFIYYLSRLPAFRKFAEGRMEGTSGRQRVSWQSLADFEIELPERDIRKKNGKILKSLDDKIELNNQMNKTLKEIAQNIYKHWFVDFDFPNEAGKPYKSTGGEMEPSEMGLIPKGWVAGKLGDIIDVNPKEPLSRGDDVKYIDMRSLSQSQSIIDIPIIRKYKGSGSRFKNGDTLVARITPCLENGKTGYVDFMNDNEVAWGSTEFIVLRSKVNVPKELSYFIARDENFRAYAISNMTGSSGRQRVPADRIVNYPFVTSDLHILKQFGEVIRSFMVQIKKNREENISLYEMRETLLPNLMSGKVKVS